MENMKVRDVIHYLFGDVVIENESEDDVLFHFSSGWSNGVPSDVSEAEVLKMYAENGILFVTTNIK